MRLIKVKVLVILASGLLLNIGHAGDMTQADWNKSITQRAGNNFRTAAYNQETILNKSNVETDFGLLNRWKQPYLFNAKVETQPLILVHGAGADDLIIITTMKNEVIGINARTKAQVYKQILAPAIDTIRKDKNGVVEIDKDGKPLQDMDMWKHTPNWGISATPIIDPSTNTLFIAAWVKHDSEDRTHIPSRDYQIFMLDPKTGRPKKINGQAIQPVTISSQSPAIQNGDSCRFRDKDATDNGKPIYPKLRAGLALTGNNGLVLAFAADGEKQVSNVQANPHGFVVAYDTRGLLAQKGFSQEPAMFCTTSAGSWGGGIWQAGGAPVTEGDTIYVATSNGTSNGGEFDLAESMIKLQFLPSTVSGDKPVLKKLDFYKAFMDEPQANSDLCLSKDDSSEVSCGRAPAGRAAADWDFGASGPLLVPASNLLLQGTKDGIIYSLDKTDLGKTDLFNHLFSTPPLVASYFGGNEAESLDRVHHLNRSIPCPAMDNGDHGWMQPCGNPENNKMHHIHSMAFAQHDESNGGIVYIWGENSNLKAYDFSITKGKQPVFRAEGNEMASIDKPSPGGMPGGLLMLSGQPSLVSSLKTAIDFNSAIIWAVYAKFGDANKEFADGQLIAYDATTPTSDRKLKRLFRTGDDKSGGLGKMSRMIPPVVANGKVYVLTYRVDDPNKCTVGDNQRMVCSQLQVFGLKSGGQ